MQNPFDKLENGSSHGGFQEPFDKEIIVATKTPEGAQNPAVLTLKRRKSLHIIPHPLVAIMANQRISNQEPSCTNPTVLNLVFKI